MSTFEINKIVGAILLVSLVAMVVGLVGNALVQPRQHEAVVAGGEGGQAPAGGTQQQEQKKEPAQVPPIGPLLAKASAEKGEKAARKCATCHTFKQGEKAKIGPNLWNVVENDKANNEGFAYSGALKEQQGKWTYEELNTFLHDPKASVPGTKMVFPGVKKDSERADIIAYLRSLSDSPPALPKGGGGEGGGEKPAGGAETEQPQGGGGPQGAGPGGKPAAQPGGDATKAPAAPR